MISARLSTLYALVAIFLLEFPLQAEVVVRKRVDSWDQEGYLMVVGTMIIAFSLCLFFSYYEYRRKKK